MIRLTTLNRDEIRVVQQLHMTPPTSPLLVWIPAVLSPLECKFEL
jgi:hypothetical protein